MAFEFKNRWHIIPSAWLAISVALAFSAGYLCCVRTLWWIVFAIGSIICVMLMIMSVLRLNKRLRYLVEATLTGDF